MQDTFGLEDAKRLGKRHAGVEPPPGPRVPHPVDIESVRPHANDPCKRRVELFAEIFCHARPVALEEPISSCRPGTANVDQVVPLGRPDLRQEARLQDVTDEGLAGRNDCSFLRFVRQYRPSRVALALGHVFHSPFFSDSSSTWKSAVLLASADSRRRLGVETVLVVHGVLQIARLALPAFAVNGRHRTPQSRIAKLLSRGVKCNSSAGDSRQFFFLPCWRFPAVATSPRLKPRRSERSMPWAPTHHAMPAKRC